MSQPSSCALHAGGSGLHVVLRIEVGAGHVRRSGGVNDRQMALVVERLERRKGWMQAEEAIEIDDLVLRDRDGGTHRVVVLFFVGDDNVESVGGSALKDNHQAAAGVAGGSFGEHGADKKAWDRGRARDGKGTVAQEKSPGGLHCASPSSVPSAPGAKGPDFWRSDFRGLKPAQLLRSVNGAETPASRARVPPATDLAFPRCS